jgi:DNA-binding MarR family transcriptional regulator
MQEREYYSLSEVTLLLINEGFTRYAVSRAIDRLKVTGQLSIEPDPTDERVKRVKREDVERIRTYLRTGK